MAEGSTLPEKQDSTALGRAAASASVSARSLTSKPTLPELLSFKPSENDVNIVQHIGTHYSTLGPLLLNDDTGAVTQAITNEYRQNADTINQEIVRRWLLGQGKQPVTWSTLIGVMKDVKLLELAEMIEKDCDLATLKTLREENTELRQQLECSRQQLQQQKRQMESEKEELVRELDQAQQQLTQLRQQEQSKRTHIERLQQSSEALLKDINNFLGTKQTKWSRPIQSATVNHPTHVIVQLTDSSNRPCSVRQKVTAQLELISKATPTSPPMEPPAIPVKVAATSPFRYEVSYTAVNRGQYQLNVKLNDIDISGSPFNITVYPDPNDLGHPVRVVTNLDNPYGIAFNSRGEMIVTQRRDDQCLTSVVEGKIQEYGDSTVKMGYPKGIAIDDMDNIYVSSFHRLRKFTSSGELIKDTGQKGSKEGEFDVPHGVMIYGYQLYVCDRGNHRIQVFDLDLNFIRSIGSYGKGQGEFNAPKDVKFDTDGNMYVTEIENPRVQVLDRNGHFIRLFGDEGEGKLNRPSCLHFVDKYIYVSDFFNNCILVYETSGEFVTSFGEYGEDKGHFNGPRCITSCADGFIYVCDSSNGRIQIF